jgi:hypothetical protein
MSIIIKISPTVTVGQRQDPRFQRAHRDATNFFNSPAHFTAKFRAALCCHEAGHITYARLAGATDVTFHGPQMTWCYGCTGCNGNEPSIFRSAVGWTLPPDCDPILALKANLGGIVFRERLTDMPNDEAAVESDMEGARKWWYEYVGDENTFVLSVEAAREEIIKDLRSPGFRRSAWDTSREFEQAIFPST